jgi:hypothetical protein
VHAADHDARAGICSVAELARYALKLLILKEKTKPDSLASIVMWSKAA